MDHAGYLIARVGPDRDHETAVAEGDDLLLDRPRLVWSRAHTLRRMGQFEQATDTIMLSVTLDDQPPRVVPRFDAYCTYHRLSTLLIGSDLPDTADSSDGSFDILRISTVLPPDPGPEPTVLADSEADWSADGTQGPEWFYGWYDVRADVEGEVLKDGASTEAPGQTADGQHGGGPEGRVSC